MNTNFASSFGFSIANLRLGTLKKELLEELEAKLMDNFLESLLSGMKLAFSLSTSQGYRKNIRNFECTYLFKTKKGGVGVAAIFKNGKLSVEKKPEKIPEWDVRVTFSDPLALRRFLLSKDPDILQSLLKNEVETKGNLNYLYKFGFMVEDLVQRFEFDGISAWFKNIAGFTSAKTA